MRAWTLCLSIIAVTAMPMRLARAQADTVWREVYLKDLEFARDVIASDHPGSVDNLNPAFRQTLSSAYKEAIDAAQIINSYESYRIALGRFGNRFQDGHLNVGPRQSRSLKGVRAAGLYPIYRNGKFVIQSVDDRYGAEVSALKGAMLTSCDGKPIETHFRNTILSWRGRPNAQADWYKWAPFTLIDYGPPTAAAPSRCTLTSGPRSIDVTLKWDSLNSRALSDASRESSGFAVHPLGVKLESDGSIWLDIPSFAIDGDSVPRMRATIDSLRALLKSNPKWPLIVIDLRGNDGGSSVWAAEIAQAIFGERWLDQAEKWLSDGRYIQYRVSKRNLESLEGQLKQSIERHGAESESVKGTRMLIDSMKAAYSRGDSLFGPTNTPSGDRRPQAVPVPGRIVVVTSSSCFSACLDFMDLLLLHPSVIHVGQPTAVDTQYMENWGWTSPSGIIQVGYPMKVYRNRRRAGNEAYVPRVRRDDLSDTDSLQEWIKANYSRWQP
ncbi:MAG TPA: S41 family peptidase [Gemmatimonadaceae bacterium]